MKKVLITGGNGFLGTNLARHLSDTHKYTIVSVDLDDKMRREAHSASVYRPPCIYRDLSASSMILDFDADYVIHLAAWPHVDYSFYHPDKSMINNLNSLINMAAFCLKNNVSLLFASSVEIYGQTADSISYENQPAAPLSPYGCSKQCCEAILNSYIQMGLRANIIRLTNLYGPYQLPDRIIPRMITRALLDTTTDIDPDYCRDFLYVDDASAAFHAVMESDGIGRIYNLSSGSSYSMREIADQISALSHKTYRINTSELNTASVRGKSLRISSDKIRSELGWNPTVGLTDGLRQTFQWYQDNRDWWEYFSKMILHDRSNSQYIIDCVLRLYRE